MEKILLINTENKDLIRAASNMRIKNAVVMPSAYNKTLQELYEDSSKLVGEKLALAKSETDSMVVFCEVTEKHMDKLLFEMRRMNMGATFKVALTATNKQWTVKETFLQMQRERLEYMKKGLI